MLIRRFDHLNLSHQVGFRLTAQRARGMYLVLKLLIRQANAGFRFRVCPHWKTKL